MSNPRRVSINSFLKPERLQFNNHSNSQKYQSSYTFTSHDETDEDRDNTQGENGDIIKSFIVKEESDENQSEFDGERDSFINMGSSAPKTKKTDSEKRHTSAYVEEKQQKNNSRGRGRNQGSIERENHRFERTPPREEVEQDREIHDRVIAEPIPEKAWQSQVIKSTRSYFDSCRDGALDYLSKLEQTLSIHKKSLSETLTTIRSHISNSLSITGDKIKEHLYLCIDEAIEQWKVEQEKWYLQNQLNYIGDIYELQTQVEERIKQMGQFRRELDHQVGWKVRASDIITSNYEGDVVQLARICVKSQSEAMRSSEGFIDDRNRRIEGTVARNHATVQEKIKQIIYEGHEQQNRKKMKTSNNKPSPIFQSLKKSQLFIAAKTHQHGSQRSPTYKQEEENGEVEELEELEAEEEGRQSFLTNRKNSRERERYSSSSNRKQIFRNQVKREYQTANKNNDQNAKMRKFSYKETSNNEQVMNTLQKPEPTRKQNHYTLLHHRERMERMRKAEERRLSHINK